MKEKYQFITAHDNIGIGKSTDATLTTVKTAALQTGAHDFIRTFGGFYDTELRKEHQNYESTYHDDHILRAEHYAHIRDSDDEDETPFMVRALSGKLHSRRLVKGKRLRKGSRPPVDKTI